MYPDFHSKGNKKYIPITKGPKPKEEEKPNEVEKTTTTPAKVEKKPEVKPKTEEKQEDPEGFKTYKFLKSSFPKKSSFKEWIAESKFNHEEVIQKVEKIEGN